MPQSGGAIQLRHERWERDRESPLVSTPADLDKRTHLRRPPRRHGFRQWLDHKDRGAPHGALQESSQHHPSNLVPELVQRERSQVRSTDWPSVSAHVPVDGPAAQAKLTVGTSGFSNSPTVPIETVNDRRSFARTRPSGARRPRPAAEIDEWTRHRRCPW